MCYFSKVFGYYNCMTILPKFYECSDVKGFMQWELILYLPPTECFTSTRFFELACEFELPRFFLNMHVTRAQS